MTCAEIPETGVRCGQTVVDRHADSTYGQGFLSESSAHEDAANGRRE